MRKPRILLTTPYYLPGFKSGGPLRSIQNLVNTFHEEFDFLILTSDRDLGDELEYDEISGDEWQKVGNAYVRYLNPAEQSFMSVLRIINEVEHDILYLNSFFARWSSVYPLIGKRFGLLTARNILLAPRGEFSKGAISQKKIRKRIYLFLFLILGFKKDVNWQASTLFESRDILREIGCSKCKIYIASDLPDPPKIRLDEGIRDSDPLLHIAFLSRICKMKNLDFALDCLKPVGDPILFNIYGPVEDQNYWSLCEERIRNLPSNVQVVYHGTVEPSKVKDVMRNNDLLFLPSLGENFGHVIAEALSVGTRVLISDQTPWRNLAKRQLGRDICLDDSFGFTEFIRQCSKESNDERLKKRVATHTSYLEVTNNNIDISANRKTFLYLASDGENMKKGTHGEI